jgi:hypothetical protein
VDFTDVKAIIQWRKWSLAYGNNKMSGEMAYTYKYIHENIKKSVNNNIMCIYTHNIVLYIYIYICSNNNNNNNNNNNSNNNMVVVKSI